VQTNNDINKIRASDQLELTSILTHARLNSFDAQAQMIEGGIADEFNDLKLKIGQEAINDVLISEDFIRLCEDNDIVIQQYSDGLWCDVIEFDLHGYMQSPGLENLFVFVLSLYAVSQNYQKMSLNKSIYINKYRLLMRAIYHFLLAQSIRAMQMALSNKDCSKERLAILAYKLGKNHAMVLFYDQSSFDDLYKFFSSAKASKVVTEGKHDKRNKQLELIEDKVRNDIKLCYKKYPLEYPNGIIRECKNDIYKDYKSYGITYKEIDRIIKEEGKRIGRSWRKNNRKDK
jgi:hypothetical protein